MVVVVEETEDDHHHVYRPVSQDRVLVLSHLGKGNKLHFSILKRKKPCSSLLALSPLWLGSPSESPDTSATQAFPPPTKVLSRPFPFVMIGDYPCSILLCVDLRLSLIHFLTCDDLCL